MSEKEEIKACPRCGSTNLNFSSMGQGFHQPGGVAPPQISCRDCEWIGFIIIFESEEEYNKFLKELRKK